jgi:hypothetical protein
MHLHFKSSIGKNLLGRRRGEVEVGIIVVVFGVGVVLVLLVLLLQSSFSELHGGL